MASPSFTAAIHFYRSLFIAHAAPPCTKPMVFFPVGLFLGHSIAPLIVPPVSFQLLKSSLSGKWLSNSSGPQKD